MKVKKLLPALVLVLCLVFSSVAHASLLGDLFGGLTSLIDSDSDAVYGVGETVEVDNTTIVLKNVITSDGGSSYTPESGHEYLILEFKVENDSDEELTISSLLCFDVWCDGSSCSISLEALGSAMFSGKPQLDCVIEPGDSFTGVVGYEVPTDWEEVKVEFSPEVYGGDSVTFLIEQ